MKTIETGRTGLFLLFFLLTVLLLPKVEAMPPVKKSAPAKIPIISIIDDRSGKFTLKQRLFALVELAEDDSAETSAALSQLYKTWSNAGLWSDSQEKHLYYALGQLITLRKQNTLADSGQ